MTSPLSPRLTLVTNLAIITLITFPVACFYEINHQAIKTGDIAVMEGWLPIGLVVSIITQVMLAAVSAGVGLWRMMKGEGRLNTSTRLAFGALWISAAAWVGLFVVSMMMPHYSSSPFH